MSRSYRHTPIMGISGNNRNSPAQKQFKQQEHQRERALVRSLLKNQEYEDLPDPEKFGNEWDSPRDGKAWFGNCKYMKPMTYINWPEKYKEWMRK